MELGWAAVSPSLDFTNTSTTYLADDPRNWPGHFIISGFSYDRFGSAQGLGSARPWDQAARCAWLSHQSAYDAGPYEQAARVFREHGYASGAEEILIAQRRDASRVPSGRAAVPRRILDEFYGTTVKYGYQPGRVLWLLAVLLILVVVSLNIPAGRATLRGTDAAGDVYSTGGLLRDVGGAAGDPARAPAGPASAVSGPGAPPGGGPAGTAAGPANLGPRPDTRPPDVCGDGQIRCFSPVLYAIDTVVPLVSLEQRSTWYADPHEPDGTFMQWWLNFATLLGWVLSSIFVLSLARIARSSQ
jgi:hypothetical protein